MSFTEKQSNISMKPFQNQSKCSWMFYPKNLYTYPRMIKSTRKEFGIKHYSNNKTVNISKNNTLYLVKKYSIQLRDFCNIVNF